MNDLAVKEYSAESIEREVITYLDAIGATTELLPGEKKMFINIAKAFGLSPFKREIHITAYGKGEYRRCSIITGYEVYIKRAERTGKLDGWKVWTEGEGKDLKAVVEIYRKDQKYPFVHEAYYIECCQFNKDGIPNAIWAKQPRFMVKKTAISQAFRLCFPDDLGGMPYTETEVPPEEPRNVTEETPPPPKQPPNKKAPVKPPEPNKTQTEHKAMLADIGEILKTLDPDQLQYFTNAELDQERAVSRKAKTIEILKDQHERLKKELEKRKAAYEPAPFGDGKTPAMYTESETDDGFEDDDPDEEERRLEEMETSVLDIY